MFSLLFPIQLIILVPFVDDGHHSIPHTKMGPFPLVDFWDLERQCELTVLTFILLQLIEFWEGALSNTFDDRDHILSVDFNFILLHARYIHVDDVLLPSNDIGCG